MRIRLLADSDVDRKNNNKDFEESGFKHVEEENCSLQQIIMQEFVNWHCP